MRGIPRLFIAGAAGVGLTLAIGGTVLALHGEALPAVPASTTTTTATTTTTSSTSSTATESSTTSTVAESEHDHGLVIHDSTDGEATDVDEVNAAVFADEVELGTARFEDLAVAEAEGYVINRSSAQSPNKVEHYTLRGGNDTVLDPELPEGLVYWVDGDTAVLLGAVFVETEAENLIQPGGPLTTWHDHTEMGCPDGVDCDELGGEPPKMLHVWLFAGADTFAHDFPQAVGEGFTGFS